MTSDLSRLLNALGLLLVGIVLAAAFFDQFWFGDLPCPLCTLQRAAFIAAGFGLALNVIFGPQPSHYAVTILGAVAGAAMAIRQTLLHIVPNSGSYGNTVFGLHLYSWAFIVFALMIVGCALLLLNDRQFARVAPISTRLKPLALTAVILFVVLAIANVIATLALCGVGFCPDAPTGYWMFGASPASPPASSP